MRDGKWEPEDLEKINKTFDLERQLNNIKDELDIEDIHEQINKSWDDIVETFVYSEDILIICLSLARKALLELHHPYGTSEEIIEKYKNHFKLFD